MSINLYPLNHATSIGGTQRSTELLLTAHNTGRKALWLDLVYSTAAAEIMLSVLNTSQRVPWRPEATHPIVERGTPRP